MNRGEKWLPPGIGQSELVVRSLYKKNLYIETFTNRDESSLLAEWAPIRESRNRAAHNEIMNASDLEIVARNINALVDTKNSAKILNLKKQYEGDTSNET